MAAGLSPRREEPRPAGAGAAGDPARSRCAVAGPGSRRANRGLRGVCEGSGREAGRMEGLFTKESHQAAGDRGRWGRESISSTKQHNPFIVNQVQSRAHEGPLLSVGLPRGRPSVLDQRVAEVESPKPAGRGHRVGAAVGIGASAQLDLQGGCLGGASPGLASAEAAELRDRRK